MAVHESPEPKKSVENGGVVLYGTVPPFVWSGGGETKNFIENIVSDPSFKLLKMVLLAFWALIFFLEIRSAFVFRRKSGEMYPPHSCLEMVTV